MTHTTPEAREILQRRRRISIRLGSLATDLGQARKSGNPEWRRELEIEIDQLRVRDDFLAEQLKEMGFEYGRTQDREQRVQANLRPEEVEERASRRNPQTQIEEWRHDFDFGMTVFTNRPLPAGDYPGHMVLMFPRDGRWHMVFLLVSPIDPNMTPQDYQDFTPDAFNGFGDLWEKGQE